MITPQECWIKDECKDKPCKSFCVKLYKLNYLYEEACVDKARRKNVALRLDADKCDKEAFDTLNSIQINVESFINEGRQLFIHSQQAGNGKTSWALKLLQTYFNKICDNSALKCRALFIHVPSLLLALKDNISNKNEYVQHIKENVNKCDLVIWDDIATKAVTTFESENLLSMIDTRINAGKCNIFTSNLSDSEMHEALGDRLASRICNLDFNIEFKGRDKRGI